MNENEVKVSIILPCYNVEKYLPEALDSVVNQTLKDIEIIPVDDGSPDHCAEIIKQYAKNDSRIKPIFKSNGGYGSAVNAGIRSATGKYIAILEPDDFVMEDYYEILYCEASSDDLDICGVNSYCELRDMAKPKLIQAHWVDNPDYLSYEGVNEYFSAGTVGITLKIYRREFLLSNNIYLSEDLKAYHDIPFVAEALSSSNKSRIIIGAGYYYRKDNIQSTTKSKANFVGIVDAIKKVEESILRLRLRDSRKAALVGYCIRHLLHYYNISRNRLSSHAASDFILSEINRLLTQFSYISILSGSAKSIRALFPGNIKIIEVTHRIINFGEQPSFDIDQFNHKEPLHVVISKLYFFSSFANNLKEDVALESFKNRLANMLNMFPGLHAKPITDFIKSTLQVSVLDFPKNYNQNWYLSFFLYLFKYDNENYLSFISDSINDSRPDTTIARFYPSIVDNYPVGYSSIDSAFRKNSVINRCSKLYFKEFIDFIRGKSIALVGNSSCEIGKGKGSEIDSYDIVIRYNNFSTDLKYIQDYGSKTTVWAITPGIESLNYRDDLKEFEYVITPDLGNKLHGVRMDILYDYIISGGSFLKFESIGCRRFTNIVIPSIGLYTMFLISQHVKHLQKVGLYGFSPLTAKQKNRHYFKGDKVPTSSLAFHDWDKENEIFNYFVKLFSGHNERFI